MILWINNLVEIRGGCMSPGLSPVPGVVAETWEGDGRTKEEPILSFSHASRLFFLRE
jgi:hypothetical protein